MNFAKKGHKGAKRNDALKEAFKTIQTLEDQKAGLLKQKKRIQKKLERIQKRQNENSDDPMKVNNNESIDTVSSNLTPKSKAEKDMRAAGLSPRKHKTIKKKLVFSNVLQEEVTKSDIRKKCSVKVAVKYRLIRAFGKSLVVNRKTLMRKKKQPNEKKTHLPKGKVQAFFEREDNCITLPGKRDSISKDKIQKKILTDYLHNLHAKFCLEHPEIRISRSRFSHMRPKHILLVNFCNRNTCLCSRHQNIALKIRTIQEIAGTKNPDDFIAKNTDDEIQGKLSEITKPEVTFTEWKRQEENKKLRWKQVQTVVSKQEFIDMLTLDLKEFREHVQRVKIQYGQMKQLRENLTEGHALVWMDFAENFTCAALDEVQSAYWTSEQVTLHTTVVYFPKSHEKTHKSIVGISDVNVQNAGMVVAMVSKRIPMIKAEYPALNCVHYLTDSPTSQYRNKSIFQFLCRHTSLFGINARWDYLEAGHGKGPCDGLGGSVKRSADMAVKQGKAVIQNAKDFYSWTQNQTECESSVSYYYISQEDYDSSSTDMKQKSAALKAIPGTFKLHAVVPVGENRIATRDLSCNCRDCLNDVISTSCNGWRLHDIGVPVETDKNNNTINTTTFTDIEDRETSDDEFVPERIKVECGEYCAAIYDGEWYIGVVTDINETDCKTKINFMEEAGKIGDSFRWPSKRDEIWIPSENIFTKIPEPYPSGKRMRLFKLGKDIIDLIEMLFEKRL